MLRAHGTLGHIVDAGPFAAVDPICDSIIEELTRAPETRTARIHLFRGSQEVDVLSDASTPLNLDGLVADAAARGAELGADGIVLAFTGKNIFLAPGTYESRGNGDFTVFAPPDPDTYQHCVVVQAEAKGFDRVVVREVSYYPRPVTTGSIEILEEKRQDTSLLDPSASRAPVLEPVREVWDSMP